MSKVRIAIGALSLSASALVGLWMHEGWTDTAVVPVKGDVPTVGPGLTKRPDGSPVQMGDTIKPLEGAQRSLAHIQRAESRLRQCVTAPVSQGEYDLLAGHAYQYGAEVTCGSTVVRETNAGRYREACEAYLLYGSMQDRTKPRQADGKYPLKNCAIKESGCRGVWLRAQERRDQCVAQLG